MKLLRQAFTQEMHCCGDDADQANITLELCDGGGGDYLVMHAAHFSFNDDKEVDELAEKMKAMLKGAES